MAYRFHAVGVATTETNDKFAGCPYTDPMRGLIAGLVKGGHEVYHYCNPGSESAGEDIFVTKQGFLQDAFGLEHYSQYHADPKPDGWSRVCRDFSIATASEIRKRAEQNDFVLFPCDGTQDMIDLLNDIEGLRFVETNIGYNDPLAEFRIFPTHTWRSFWRGRSDRAQSLFEIVQETSAANGHVNPINHNPNVMVSVTEPRWVYDAVIPFLTNPSQFECCEDKEDYYLFLGRIIHSKGILEAIAFTEQIGKRLVIAGPGDYFQAFGQKPPKHVDFFGMADVDARRKLLAKAKCLLAFTRYNEPCGKIVLEAGWSATAVNTSNSGGFTETVVEGVNGFRGDCMAEWIENDAKLETLEPKTIREHAEQRFSPEVLLPRYEKFWKRIDGFRKSGDIDFTF